MIKLVVCDVDGTLVGPSEALPADLRANIRLLESRGIRFTVATGRSDGYMADRIRAMGLIRPYIANNGATIMEGTTALMRKQFPIAGLRDIQALAQELGMSMIYTFAGEERAPYITPWILHEVEKHRKEFPPRPFSDDEWNGLMADKVLIYDKARTGRIEEIEAICRNVPRAGCVRYGEKAVELMEATANKATALHRLMSILEVAPYEVLAIGDDANDVELFQTVGASAAVANAREAAKASAGYVCRGAEYQGVKEAILRFCGVEL